MPPHGDSNYTDFICNEMQILQTEFSLRHSRMTAGYPFDDFRRHLHDVTHRRFFRDSDDHDASFVVNVLKIRDYLSEFYEDDELAQKVVLFVEMYRHISVNAAAYDVGLLGIRDHDGIHASDALQFAIRWYFTSRRPADWNSPDAVDKIKAKANEWTSSQA